jgi:hypothetical protein
MSLEQGAYAKLLLEPGPFDILLPPSQRKTKFGGTEQLPRPEDTSISVNQLEVRIGTRILARDLRELYLKTHKEFPEDLEVFSQYDIWIIPHVISAIRRSGWESVRALGYQATFGDSHQGYTVDLLPAPQFTTQAKVEVGVTADLGVEGQFEIPDGVRKFLPDVEPLSADAQCNLSAETKLIGRLGFSLITAKIQAVGVGDSRCEWLFSVDDKPLLGDQRMFQTVLVHRGTESLMMRVRGYARIRTGWSLIPAMFWTKWADLEVHL